MFDRRSTPSFLQSLVLSLQVLVFSLNLTDFLLQLQHQADVHALQSKTNQDLSFLEQQYSRRINFNYFINYRKLHTVYSQFMDGRRSEKRLNRPYLLLVIILTPLHAVQFLSSLAFLDPRRAVTHILGWRRRSKQTMSPFHLTLEAFVNWQRVHTTDYRYE